MEVELLDSPAGENSSLPFLYSNSKATLLSWVEKPNDSLTVFRYATMMNGAWQGSKEITRGTDWFVNWADFPAIVENKGNLLSHILRKSSTGTYSYDVKMNLKPEGEDWRTDIPLHNDATATEHGFVTALPYQDGSFFATWLDGRNTEEKEGSDRGSMTIRAAEVSPYGKISNEALLDSRTCDCCQTTAAITENGPVVIYRDRSKDEIRDISIVRRIDGGWSKPKVVHHDNWKIKGCPVNGPKAVALESTLAVVWFTEANKQPEVKISFSQDNGLNFENPINLGVSNVIGRVDIVILDADTVVVSYVETNDKTGWFKAVKVHSSGKVSNPKIITEVNPTRKSGFPQMELVGDTAHFAWTEIIQESTKIKTASLSMAAF